MNNIQEIQRRRTFGIVSHPDAGKTTLTEKLLYFGGAIQVAGEVKARKIKKYATSDFMEIEKQRGISVATSVMGFEYKDYKINILDTPGHKDFCEDTYRTLTAVDSVIMVIDHVKGVESQTEKLLEVCRMRNTPVITFVNKLDREGNDIFDTLDEIEKKLSIGVNPFTVPIGMGKSFKGIYHLQQKEIILLDNQSNDNEKISLEEINSSAEWQQKIGKENIEKLNNDIELIETVYEKFDRKKYLVGETTPIFFGSGVNNFGVRELLHSFLELSPPPQKKQTTVKEILPEDREFSGFVFKIHANIDPKHRNRIAFLKVCSGVFQRNKKYYHVRHQKEFKFSNPTAFMAKESSILEKAYPGDIVGLYDNSNFKIGDTLTEGENFFFQGIPTFSPEIFKSVTNNDPLKQKQLYKGIAQLMDEGVAQQFVMNFSGKTIIGTVGELQFEVIQYRLLHEYSASCEFSPLPIYKACWMSGKQTEIQKIINRYPQFIAKDKDEQFVYLAESPYFLQRVQEDFSEVQFSFSSEVNKKVEQK